MEENNLQRLANQLCKDYQIDEIEELVRLLEIFLNQQTEKLADELFGKSKNKERFIDERRRMNYFTEMSFRLYTEYLERIANKYPLYQVVELFESIVVNNLDFQHIKSTLRADNSFLNYNGPKEIEAFDEEFIDNFINGLGERYPKLYLAMRLFFEASNEFGKELRLQNEMENFRNQRIEDYSPRERQECPVCHENPCMCSDPF